MDVFDFLQYMVEEEHNALNEILEKIDNDLLDKPLEDGSSVTIRDRLQHTIVAEFRMAGYLFEVEDDDFQGNFSTVEEIKSSSLKSKARHEMTLRNLTDNDMDKVWTSKVSGNSYTYKFLLWHFIEHIATHRGQISSAVRRYTKKD